MTEYKFYITRRQHHLGDGITNLLDDYPLATTNRPHVFPIAGTWPMPVVFTSNVFTYDSYIEGFDKSINSTYVLNPNETFPTLNSCKVTTTATQYHVFNSGRIYLSSGMFLYREHDNYDGNSYEAAKLEATNLIAKLVNESGSENLDWNVCFFTNIISGGVPLYVVFYPGNDSNSDEILSVTIETAVLEEPEI